MLRASLFANTHFRCHHLGDSLVPVQKKVIIFSAPAGTREKPKNIVLVYFLLPKQPPTTQTQTPQYPRRLWHQSFKSFFVEHIWKMLDLVDQEGQAHTSNLLKPFLNRCPYAYANCLSMKPCFCSATRLGQVLRPHPRGRHETPSCLPPGTFPPVKKHKPTETHVSHCSLGQR